MTRRRCCRSVGATNLDELIAQTVPASIRQRAPLNGGPALSETEALDKLREIASKNKVCTSLIGQGYYGTILPPVIQRNILENPAWYTAYTPYQPEISQGRLEALLNFQTMIADLTGLDIANASLLDEGTAAAEAMAMAHRLAGNGKKAFFVDADCHPQTIAVVRTRAEPLGWSIIVGDPLTRARSGGGVRRTAAISRLVRRNQKLRACDRALCMQPARSRSWPPIRWRSTLLKSPGELGADIAIGSTQRFGVPVGYGGPHAAYIATKDDYKRTLPGRIVGVSVDSRGRPGLSPRLADARAAYPARESDLEHLHRAGAAGGDRIDVRRVSRPGWTEGNCRAHPPPCAHALPSDLQSLGWRVRTKNFFDTITVEAGDRQRRDSAQSRRARHQSAPHRSGDGNAAAIGISCDETTTPAIVEELWRVFGHADGKSQGELSFASVAQHAGDRRRICAPHRFHDASGVSPLFVGDRIAALHAAPLGSRPRARPLDDPARFLHHEAQCHRGDDTDHLAGICQHSSVRAGRSGAWL